MTDALTIGILLGLSAGLAPGPLLMLVISETLQNDVRSGVKVALAPLITDLPIIALTVLVLSELAKYRGILGIVSLTGGCFVLFLGYKGVRFRGVEIGDTVRKPQSLKKGILVNALSPHPYLFWAAVGGPTLTKAMAAGPVAPLLFLLGFYGLLVGSKILLAILVGRSKTFLSGALYLYLMRFVGLMLCLLAVSFFHEGLALLGLI